tara:strand:- start:3033 stop:3179 length:147 start_codon:yes stop_codon:yes gene_type:complete
MKKIKIPLNAYFSFLDPNFNRNTGNTKLSEEEKLINSNRKYFNHIGLA